MKKSNGFHLINVVWGEEYMNLFLEVCLPTQLSTGNIPAFHNEEISLYKIYTTAKDAEIMVKHPTYQTLSGMIETQIKTFNLSNNYLRDYKHKAMNYCHRNAILEANKSNCTMIFLSPDTIWADGVFKKLISLEKQGKRTVMIGSFRLTRETFVSAFLERFNPNRNPIVYISSRELVSLSLKHLHPITRSFFWEKDGYASLWPSLFLWKVDNEGIVGRYFHLHPLMINPLVKNIMPYPTIDGKYVSLICPNKDDLYVVKDSDEMFYIEVSPASLYSRFISPHKSKDMITIINWMQSQTEPLHREFFKNCQIIIHANDISSKWVSVQKESELIVNQIFAEFESASL